jgi:uncharacterized protein YbjT (DUF2867 family)
MHALVAGGTGLVGAELVQRLAKAPEYGSISAWVRKPPVSGPAKVEWLPIDFDALDRALAAKPVDHAFCCLGTTLAQAGSPEAFRRVDYDLSLAFAKRAKHVGAKRLVAVSSLGADPKARNLYLRTKGELEVALQSVGFEQLVVLRPSLLLGTRTHPRPAEAMAAAAGRGFGWMLVGPLRKFRPISGAHVAAAMLRLALAPDSQASVVVLESNELEALALQQDAAPTRH